MRGKPLEKVLARTEALLRKKPMTAQALASRMKCSIPAAYRRIHLIEQRLGSRVKVTYIRDGSRGAERKAYFVR